MHACKIMFKYLICVGPPSDYHDPTIIKTSKGIIPRIEQKYPRIRTPPCVVSDDLHAFFYPLFFFK